MRKLPGSVNVLFINQPSVEYWGLQCWLYEHVLWLPTQLLGIQLRSVAFSTSPPSLTSELLNHDGRRFGNGPRAGVLKDQALALPISHVLVFYDVKRLCFVCRCLNIWVTHDSPAVSWPIMYTLHSLEGDSTLGNNLIVRSHNVSKVRDRWLEWIFQILWNLAFVSAALLPRHLVKFKTIRTF